MRFLVCADVEGASGVGSDSMLSGESFQQVRELITGDVNACARGIHRAAPDAKIDLFDAHGLGGNILEANLDQGVSLLGGGWIDTLFPLVSEGRLGTYDGLFLVGQHAANGTRNGFISHTNSEFAALRVNDRDAGEAEQLAWLAGAHSVPTLLVVGDDATGREVNALLLGVRTVSVKTALDRKTAECRPVEDAWEEIESAAAEATSSASSAPPSAVAEPVRIVLYFAHPDVAPLAKAFRGVTVEAEGAVRFERETFLDAWFHYQAIARTCPEFFMYKEAFRRLYKELDGAQEIAAQLTKEFNALPEREDSAIPDVRY